MIQHLADPVYVHRPFQVAKRLLYTLRPPRSEEIAKLPWGGRLTVMGSEKNGRTILHRGLKELAVTESCFRLAASGSVAVDVGANIGHMTSALAHAVQPSGAVHAFEPHPKLFEYLQQNATRLCMEVQNVNLHVYNEAVGRDAGQAALYVPDRWSDNAGLASLQPKPGASEVMVDIVRLQDRVTEPIQVLKLDVEGHEFEVLRGAERLLERKSIRHILFEDHKIRESEVAALLRSYSYTVFTVEKYLTGPKLSQELSVDDYNFIASVDAAECKSRFASTGWRCLRKQ